MFWHIWFYYQNLHTEWHLPDGLKEIRRMQAARWNHNFCGDKHQWGMHYIIIGKLFSMNRGSVPQFSNTYFTSNLNSNRYHITLKPGFFKLFDDKDPKIWWSPWQVTSFLKYKCNNILYATKIYLYCVEKNKHNTIKTTCFQNYHLLYCYCIKPVE